MTTILRSRVPRLWLAGALIVAAAITRPVPARAEARDAAAADTLFREGRKALDRRDYATACPKLAESQRLDPAPGTLMNLADCEEHIGKLADALEHWRAAIDALPQGDDRRPFAIVRASTLEGRVPKLKVVLGNDAPKGTRIARDGLELGRATLGVDLPVNPGSHILLVGAPGRETNRVTVEVSEGETKIIEVTPGPPTRDAAGAESPASAGSGLRTAGWVIGTAGVVALGAGVLGAIERSSKNSDADALCPPDQACSDPDRFHAIKGQADQWKAVEYVGLVGGGIAIAAGVVIVLATPSNNVAQIRLRPSARSASEPGVLVEGTW